MGATNFEHTQMGYSAREVFEALVSEALHNYGDDPYNGTISTCELGFCKLRFEHHNANNYKKALEHIKNCDWGEKWVADYVDLGVVEYHVLTIKKKNISDKAPSYKLKFVVRRVDEDLNSYRTPKSFATKTEADQYAMEQTLKTTVPHKVSKEYVLEKGDSMVSHTYVEKKVYKTKPNLKPMPNRRVVPVHNYLFYGWAAC